AGTTENLPRFPGKSDMRAIPDIGITGSRRLAHRSDKTNANENQPLENNRGSTEHLCVPKTLQNAPVTGQRCAGLSSHSADRRHRGISDPRWTSSPLRSNLGFRYAQVIEVGHMLGSKKASVTLRRIVSALGPGLVTGAADDDPSGIATYSQAGAQFGFSLLWTVFLTTPFMIAIQLVSG